MQLYHADYKKKIQDKCQPRRDFALRRVVSYILNERECKAWMYYNPKLQFFLGY